MGIYNPNSPLRPTLNHYPPLGSTIISRYLLKSYSQSAPAHLIVPAGFSQTTWGWNGKCSLKVENTAPSLSRAHTMRAFIFDCSTNTYREYVERQLFGSFLPWPLQVRSGDLCFLCHRGIRQLSGIWRAESAGAHDLIPEAWAGRFPFQVEVRPSTLHILETALSDAEDLLINPETGRPDYLIEGERLGELVKRFRALAETLVC